MNKNIDSEELVKVLNRIYHNVEAPYYNERHPEIIYYERYVWERISDQISKMINIDKPLCLDLGSGSGFVAKQFLSFLPQSVWLCCDISFEMLKNSMLSFDVTKKVYHINTDCEKLPFANEVFDLATVNSVLHHLPNPQGFLKECKRVLKPGGLLVIAHEPNKGYFNSTFLFNFTRFVSEILVLKARLSSSKIKPMIEQKVNFDEDLKLHLEREGYSLSLKELSRLVDIHSPTAGGSIDRERGFEPYLLLQDDEWKIVDAQTYAFLAKLYFISNRLLRLTEKIFAKLFPNNGYMFWLIALRTKKTLF